MFFRFHRKIKEIGFGAYSKIFLYKHVISGKNVAVKRILKTRHTYEITHMNLLTGNKKISQLCNTFDKGIHTYMVMKYYPNGELFEPLKDMKYNTPLKIRNLMLELCNIVQLCHEQNIAHLDVKPENFVFDKNMKLVLIDFGMSQKFSNKDTLYFSSLPLGTESYAAPETLVSMYCAKSDVWSLGMIFRYLCDCLSIIPLEFEEIAYSMLQIDTSKRAHLTGIIKKFDQFH